MSKFEQEAFRFGVFSGLLLGLGTAAVYFADPWFLKAFAVFGCILIALFTIVLMFAEPPS